MSPEILALLQYQKDQEARRNPAVNPEDYSLLPDSQRFEPSPISAWVNQVNENAHARYRQMMGDSIKQNQPAPVQESLVPQRGAAMSPEQMAATHPLLNPNSPVQAPIGISGKFRRGPSESISADARLIQRNIPYAGMIDPSEIERLENYRKALLNQKQQGNIAPFLGWIEDEYGARNLVRTYEKPQDLSDKAVAITRTIHNLKRGVTQDKISMLKALLKAKKKDEKDLLSLKDKMKIKKDFSKSKDKEDFDGLSKFADEVKQYLKALEGVKEAPLRGAKATQLESLYNKLLTTMNREEAELGALAGQDLSILKGILKETYGVWGEYHDVASGGIPAQRKALKNYLRNSRVKAARNLQNLQDTFPVGAEDQISRYAERLGSIWGPIDEESDGEERILTEAEFNERLKTDPEFRARYESVNAPPSNSDRILKLLIGR